MDTYGSHTLWAYAMLTSGTAGAFFLWRKAVRP